MSESTCLHENTSEVKDMPLCDEELNFIGRFDGEVCSDCGVILTQLETNVPPPIVTPGGILLPDYESQ